MTGKSKPDLAFLPGRKSGRARARFVCAALAALALSACATSGDISYRELLGELMSQSPVLTHSLAITSPHMKPRASTIAKLPPHIMREPLMMIQATAF